MTPEIQNFLLLLLWSNIERKEGCWIWTGPYRRRDNLARAIYEMTQGSIPAGFTVTTTCHTQYCIRPAHVILGRQWSIKDEFTHLPVCRERKRQLRKLKAGLCRHSNCNLSVVTAEWCKTHAIEVRERQRVRSGSVRRNNTLTYRL